MAGEALAGLRDKPWMPFIGVTVGAVVLALLASAGVGVLVRLPEGAKVSPAMTAEDIASAGGLPTNADDVTATVTAGADAGADAGGSSAEGLAAAIHAGRRLSKDEYVKGILGRNIFDPSKIGQPECVGDDCPDGQQSELKVTLKGTVVAVPAAYSAAFIAEEGKETVHAYGIGQKVQGAEILEIQDKRVRVRNPAGAEEWLEVGVEKPASAGDGAKPPAEGGITGDGETNFTIDRTTLNAALGNMDELSGMARALLHRGPDGEYDGYRLSAIRRDTLPDKVGIRNGDIIHSVNGLPINSLDGAMKALDALKTQPNLKVEVTRRGQPTTLNYDIR